MKGKEIELNCIIEKEGKIFSALCLELDVASCGNTPQEAAENLKDAIVSYLDYAVASGKFEEYVPRPVPRNVLRQYKGLKMHQNTGSDLGENYLITTRYLIK